MDIVPLSETAGHIPQIARVESIQASVKYSWETQQHLTAVRNSLFVTSILYLFSFQMLRAKVSVITNWSSQQIYLDMCLIQMVIIPMAGVSQHVYTKKQIMHQMCIRSKEVFEPIGNDWVVWVRWDWCFFQSCWPTRDHIGRPTGISNPAWHLPQVVQGLFRPQAPCTSSLYCPIANSASTQS